MNDITIALSAIDNALRIVKSLKEAGKQIDISQITLELQGIILSLQGKLNAIHKQYLDLLREKEQINSELIQYKNWDIERDKYILCIPDQTCHPFRLKPATCSG